MNKLLPKYGIGEHIVVNGSLGIDSGNITYVEWSFIHESWIYRVKFDTMKSVYGEDVNEKHIMNYKIYLRNKKLQKIMNL